ncbi:cytochrome P450 [Sulfitobacter pseudonitzschiae]|uniref:Cytochrome P450 n=1 Tax=Pseudosulfitobacter pseudonitzschiae TaxID=1402135 RepID=A0A9Q2S0L2_9RHOB|nr:cytochrome P450 [Pseudosulfitobacter pseudonitzschiae]MBM2292672.1 cytochrome P450 [Pseudosulfitobacter pseudonitzschiae]MBM2297589.1 cytochrome P450 [Pseudosulfitobacter pseudonitzschiae]MBM2302503.1 cytochrome P450 [Pseudosulfitobacter pseudonitzschiae]MBM2312286.1 cytochrome P450 [Pseudosulfitobacter pseudonitzschiae]MBM2317199.1 cytochrome P450 [Pseudosulfitobacter pseudonitzschiae]
MPDTVLPQATHSPLPVRVPLVTEPWGLLKSLQEARRNVLSIIPEIATTQPMVSGKTGKRWHMVMDPTAIREILLDRLDQYPKSLVTKNLLKPAIGESLFIAEGAHWRWQRRTAAPVFSHRNVSALAPIMSDAADRACKRIAAAGPRAVNLLDEMVTTTFDVIADVTFSGGDTFDRDAVHGAIDDYIAEAGKISLFDILGFPDWVPRPGRVMSGKALKEMKSVADQAIEARAERGTSAVPDLLDLLLAGEDPKSGRTMSTAELRDNLLTFIVAGHETTALTLAWSMYLVAFDQDVQDRARAEAQQVLQGRAAGADDVADLPVIRQIVDEALRLYPPAGIVSRTALKNDTLGGREILPGDTVMIPIYALGRSKLLWEDADAFRPERFADRKAIDRYAYLPFGDGPRICIGASFALQEAVIILATLLSRFRFKPVVGRDPEPVMILTLRPEGGVWLTAEAV